MPNPTVTFVPGGQTASGLWRPGDFLLLANSAPWYSKSGFVSAAIRTGEYKMLKRAGIDKDEARKRSHWSHAVGVSDGHLVEAEASGVVRSPLEKYSGQDYVYVATDLSDELRGYAYTYLEAMVGVRYGFPTIAAIALRAEFAKSPLAFMAPCTVICSGLVAAMLETLCWRTNPSWVKPSDLADYHGIDLTTYPDP